MDIKEQFIKEVEDFLSLSGMAYSTFGRATMDDGSFVVRLLEKKGKQTKTVSVKTVDHVRNWMRENKHLLRQAAE